MSAHDVSSSDPSALGTAQRTSGAIPVLWLRTAKSTIPESRYVVGGGVSSYFFRSDRLRAHLRCVRARQTPDRLLSRGCERLRLDDRQYAITARRGRGGR